MAITIYAGEAIHKILQMIEESDDNIINKTKM